MVPERIPSTIEEILPKRIPSTIEEIMEKVNFIFNEVCPMHPKHYFDQDELDLIPGGGKNLSISTTEDEDDWNPIRMDKMELFNMYTDEQHNQFENIQNWYRTITGKGNSGTRLWKQLVKKRLIEIEPDYKSIVDTVELEEKDAYVENIHPETGYELDLPDFTRPNSIIIKIRFKKDVTDDETFIIETNSETKIKLKAQLSADLKLFKTQIDIKFELRSPEKRFQELKTKRMKNLEKAFKMVNRLGNKKYYNFDSRETELNKIQKDIIKLLVRTISKYEGDKAAENFSRKLDKSDPF